MCIRALHSQPGDAHILLLGAGSFVALMVYS